MALSTSPFAQYKPYSNEDSILVGNGTSLPILHTGTLNISTNTRRLQLRDVIYVLHMFKLLSLYDV